MASPTRKLSSSIDLSKESSELEVSHHSNPGRRASETDLPNISTAVVNEVLVVESPNSYHEYRYKRRLFVDKAANDQAANSICHPVGADRPKPDDLEKQSDSAADSIITESPLAIKPVTSSAIHKSPPPAYQPIVGQSQSSNTSASPAHEVALRGRPSRDKPQHHQSDSSFSERSQPSGSSITLDATRQHTQQMYPVGFYQLEELDDICPHHLSESTARKPPSRKTVTDSNMSSGQSKQLVDDLKRRAGKYEIEEMTDICVQHLSESVSSKPSGSKASRNFEKRVQTLSSNQSQTLSFDRTCKSTASDGSKSALALATQSNSKEQTLHQSPNQAEQPSHVQLCPAPESDRRGSITGIKTQSSVRKKPLPQLSNQLEPLNDASTHSPENGSHVSAHKTQSSSTEHHSPHSSDQPEQLSDVSACPSSGNKNGSCDSLTTNNTQSSVEEQAQTIPVNAQSMDLPDRESTETAQSPTETLTNGHEAGVGTNQSCDPLDGTPKRASRSRRRRRGKDATDVSDDSIKNSNRQEVGSNEMSQTKTENQIYTTSATYEGVVKQVTHERNDERQTSHSVPNNSATNQPYVHCENSGRRVSLGVNLSIVPRIRINGNEVEGEWLENGQNQLTGRVRVSERELRTGNDLRSVPAADPSPSSANNASKPTQHRCLHSCPVHQPTA